MNEQKNKTAHLELFFTIVKEFLGALTKGHTYDVTKNGYSFFGLMWGIPVPIVTIWLGLYYKGAVPTLGTIVAEVIANPIHIFFLLHPVLFGVVFGAMGTVRHEKENEKREFQRRLILINEELKIANRKLQELDKLKDDFLSMVSHELWSPLTTIQGYISFMNDGKVEDLTQEQKEILVDTEEEIDHLSHLIGGLLDVSRIGTGKFQVELGCLDMRPVISKAINLIRDIAKGKNITLRNEIPAKISYVLADRERMSQVITNLLSNALKFTSEKGSVVVSAREHDNVVEFSVMDSGIGLHTDDVDKIFNKFYQVDSRGARKYGGCGLGLTITKSIIELHRGRIWVESEVGVGSKFYFELAKYSSECEEVKSSTAQEISCAETVKAVI